MATRSAPSWTCPWCERLVPARETRCHCGCDRSVAEAKVASEAAESESVGGGRALLVLGLVAICGVVFYTALRQRMSAEDAAAAAASERRRNAAVAPGSAASAEPSPDPPPGYTPPAAWISAAPRAPATVAVLPSPSPKSEGPPTASSMEEEWEKASALLEPPLQKIAGGSGALQASYERWASECLEASAAGSGGSWLERMRSAPLRTGIQVMEGGLDCVSERQSLVGRANQLRSELAVAADTARTNRVLPGHWRRLMAAHQLDVWEQF
jgi:hypothetical protein